VPANVPTIIPGPISAGQVLSGAPVRSAAWNAAANASNYLLGKQRTIIPYTSGTSWAKGVTRTFRYRAYRHVYASHRLWIMYAVMPRGTVVTFPNADTLTFQHDVVSTADPIFYYELVASRGNAESDLLLTFDTTSVSGVPDPNLVAVTCIECPRHSLAINTTDFGVDPDLIRGSFPIYASLSPPASMGALPRNFTTAIAAGRRAQFVWALPDEAP